MRVIFCGGGTAGHITPGISIAETILNRQPDSKILFIGRVGGDENQIIKYHNFELREIKALGINRSLSFKNFEAIYDLLKSTKQSKQIIKNFDPNVVIGTGGYVCWPVIKAAQQLGIPTAIHESNAHPGLTTRTLAAKCDRVLLNFTDSKNALKNKSNVKIVGNPLRKAFSQYSRTSARRTLGINQSTFFILSLGGSGGSETINHNIIRLMQNYSYKNSDVMHIHASGKRYYDDIKAKHPELTVNKNGCVIFPFIENIPLYLAAADITICRCGAMTLSEISRAGCVPILIPSPNVTDNHQVKNGKIFADKGAAIMIEESELNERTLTDAVRYLKNNPITRRRMSVQLSSFHNPNCLDLIYREIQEIIAK